LRVKLGEKMQDADFWASLLRDNPWKGMALPKGSILRELDRFHRTLVHAGPALNTILRPGRTGSLLFYFIDLAGTDLDTVSTAIAFLLVDDRIHGYFKFQISNYKYQINFT
jgi:hypothetical protein